MASLCQQLSFFSSSFFPLYVRTCRLVLPRESGRYISFPVKYPTVKGQNARARESLSALFFSVCSCERQTNGNIIFSSTVTSLLRLSLENVTRTLSNTQLLLFSFYLCADRFLCFYFVDFQLTLLLLSFVVDVQERRELCVVRDTLVPPPPLHTMRISRWQSSVSSCFFSSSGRCTAVPSCSFLLFSWQSEPTEYSRHKKMKPKMEGKEKGVGPFTETVTDSFSPSLCRDLSP